MIQILLIGLFLVIINVFYWFRTIIMHEMEKEMY